MDTNEDSDGVALSPDRYLVLPHNVDLTNCDREAIHIPGEIQSHGALLVVDPQSLDIVVASVNSSDVLGVEGPLIGRNLADLELIGIERVAGAASHAGGYRSMRTVGRRDGQGLTAVLHSMTELVIIEFEPVSGSFEVVEVVVDAASAAESLAKATNVAEARQVAVDLVRELTGFDRVMHYSFHGDGHGEVAAESLAPGIDSFLGLHYPASDIPLQARALYLRNWTRLIVDTNGPAVPLEPNNHPTNGRAINLALAQLRAVSPIHLEYLRNMGVGASMSMSLVSGNELVGLIACHHSEPRHIPFPTRASCELIARLLSEQLIRSQAAIDAAEAEERRSVQMRILRSLVEVDRVESRLSTLLEASLEVLEASGAGAFVDGTIDVVGEMPFEVSAIRHLLGEPPTQSVALERFDTAEGGVLIVRVGDTDDFFCWWRPPVARSVTWAGEPDKETAADGETLTPRTSFTQWLEVVADGCEPWTNRDSELAASLTAAFDTTRTGESDLGALIEALTAHASALERANLELTELAEEREMMLSAVAHDLRAPLRAVNSFTDVIVMMGEKMSAEELAATRARIGENVSHMSEMLDGLQRWARLGELVAESQVDLNQTIDTVLTALAVELDAAEALVRVDELPTVVGDAAALREMFQNLIENAVRYRSPGRPLKITVGADWDDDNATVFVVDNGIGIGSEELSAVFELFRRVNTNGEGLGLGLALVERIARAHGGSVRIDSVLTEGSVVHVDLCRER